ncbi:MAG: putative manganese-dependent inorganic diphosphatase [Solobacterium sp.]|nr:putative manganese-dependent inorganic diphosphatase [Solobacterium sp.]
MISEKRPVYVIGHKHPDTDAIASAYSYAELKRKMGVNAVAGRLGTLNEETKFATRYFDVEAPALILDARSQVSELDIDPPVTIHEDASVNEALNITREYKNRSICVVDDSGRLVGIVSGSDLLSIRTADQKKRNRLLSHTTPEIMARDFSGRISVPQDGFKTNGHVIICTRNDVSSLGKEIHSSICILSDNIANQKTLIEHNAALLLLTNSIHASKEIRSLAVQHGTVIIESKMSTIAAARIIDNCFPVKLIMTKKPIVYHGSEYVEDVAEQISATRFRSYPVLDEAGHPIGSISRYHLFRYPRKQFILVDHSSKVQSIDYIDQAEICEIIDHHNIGNIETVKPIYYRNQQCGCTCTIISQLYQENGLVPEQSTAGMMLSAIISDTLNFKSQTTTPLDRKTADWLARIAKVDVGEYAQLLLKASVNLKNADPYDLLTRDLKQYQFGKYHVAIGQTNYSDIEDIQSRLKAFRAVVEKEQQDKHYDLIIMMFTDVNAEGTMFLYKGPLSHIMKNIISTQFDEDTGFDHKIMSRKQQMIPLLSDNIIQ